MNDTDMQEVERLRTMFIESLEYQAAWRDEKAVQYPHDKRNENSARALRQLAKHLQAIPASDGAWLQYASVWDQLEDCMNATEQEQEELRTFGFDNSMQDVSPEDAAEFLRDYISMLDDLLTEEGD
jgi:hypothetical protein